MSDVYTVVVLWTVVAIQAVGLFSALLSRLGEGSGKEGRCQCFFLFCLALVGASTIVSVSFDLGPGGWMTSATTLSVMVLIALYDCGSRKTAEESSGAGPEIAIW